MRARAIVLLAVAAASGTACGSSSTRDIFAGSPFPPGDASADAAVVDAGGDDAEGGTTLEDGAILGAPCTDDGQCNDGVTCTYDSCDPATLRCVYIPDDSQCSDGLYCDGQEICVPFHGCESGPVVTCDNGDDCVIAKCVEATQSCAYTLRDEDLDGDPDAHCDPGHDCNDLDPDVASTLPEICANGIDDNCNGLIDEHPCTTPADATCASALPITAAGNYALETLGAPFAYPTTCSVGTPTSSHQSVALITVPPGGPQDLDVWATASTSDVAVALQSTCGVDSTEVACGGGTTQIARARGRSLAPGTYAAIVTTQTGDSVELAVDFLPPTTTPTNESCASPLPISPGTPVDLSLIDSSLDLPSQCAASVGQLTYQLTLAQAQDVRVYASVTEGDGQPVLGIRDAGCTGASDELTCSAAYDVPLFARGLAAGTYVITVAATATINATLLVETTAPTVAPPDQTCATAPALTTNTLVPVDLSTNTYAVDDGCFPGYPDAAFDLELADASDVLLVGRFAEIESGAVSFDTPACSQTTSLECTVSGTPARAAKRNVPAGSYRVVLGDTDGDQDTSITAYVRDTVPPTAISGSDTCTDAFVIGAAGGFFTGDTTNAAANFVFSCDAANEAPAPAQVLNLQLAQAQHVVFDMSGSAYTTILDIWEGSTCPGTEVGAGSDCYVGFEAQKSFLDLELDPGDYWIVIAGYAGAKGAWNLDVRVLPP